MENLGFKKKLQKKLNDTVGGKVGEKLSMVTGSDKMGKAITKAIDRKKASKQ